jgi:DNA-binding NtrC family response regulator
MNHAVFIVDDDDRVREALVDLLTSENLLVVGARNCSGAPLGLHRASVRSYPSS